MSFPERLPSLRKELGFAQQQMANQIGMHVSQLKRCEADSSQPTIEAFTRIPLALDVSADLLLFEPGERAPAERLKLQFEAVFKLDEKERDAVETMIAGVPHMHDAKRWAAAPAAPAKAKTEEPKR